MSGLSFKFHFQVLDVLFLYGILYTNLYKDKTLTT